MDDPPFEDAKVWRTPPTTPFLDNFRFADDSSRIAISAVGVMNTVLQLSVLPVSRTPSAAFLIELSRAARPFLAILRRCARPFGFGTLFRGIRGWKTH
jgi:hypothetical protein